MSWARFSLKQLRDGRVANLTLVLFTFVTCAVFAAAPRLIAIEADRTLHSALSASPVDVRGLQVIRQGRIAPSPDLSGAVDAAGTQIESLFPAAVDACIGQRSVVVDTPRFVMPASIVDYATLRLRFDPDTAARLHVIAGRLPSESVTDRGGGLLSVEVALSAESARILRVSTGSTFTARLDATDLLGAGQTGSIEVVVAGIYDVADASPAAWFNDTSLIRPNVRGLSPSVSIDDVTAYVSPAAYAGLVRPGSIFTSLRYTWRFSVDPERLSAAEAPAAIDGLQRMEGLFPASAIAARTGNGALRSGLLALLRNEAAAWNSVAAVLSMFAVGAAAVAALALMLVAVVAGRGRRRFVAILWHRGAARRHVFLSTTAEAAVLALPAAVAGTVVAILAVPAGDVVSSVALAGGVALVATAVHAASARAGTSDGSSAGFAAVRRIAGADASRRRVVLEVLAVALAALAVFELRSRGIAALAGDRAAPDPWIAAAPALVGFAASLATIRLFPLALRLLAAVASRGRGLVVVLALRLASRSGAGGPVLATLVSIATVGAFASATLVHLDRTAEAAAWQDAGASYRVVGANGVRLADALVAADLPGVEASAAISRTQYGIRVMPTGTTVALVVLDPRAYGRVVAGTTVDGAVPADSLLASGTPAPAIVSETLAADEQGTGDSLAVGETLDLLLDVGPASWRVVATAHGFPGVPADMPFVVVSRESAAAAYRNEAPPPTDLLLRAPAADAEALRAAVARLDPAARFVDATAEARALEQSPYRDAVVLGAAMAALLAAAYAALAIASAFALAGAGRSLDIAHLRMLGLSRRDALLLAIVEHVPAVVLGFVCGAAIGLWLFAFLEPGLGLAALVALPAAVPVGLEPWQLAGLFGWLVVLVAAGIGIEASFQRRTVIVAALRRGTE